MSVSHQTNRVASTIPLSSTTSPPSLNIIPGPSDASLRLRKLPSPHVRCWTVWVCLTPNLTFLPTSWSYHPWTPTRQRASRRSKPRSKSSRRRGYRGREQDTMAGSSGEMRWIWGRRGRTGTWVIFLLSFPLLKTYGRVYLWTENDHLIFYLILTIPTVILPILQRPLNERRAQIRQSNYTNRGYIPAATRATMRSLEREAQSREFSLDAAPPGFGHWSTGVWGRDCLWWPKIRVGEGG